ncbi:MAG: Arc family DNA-binding protein [Thermoanaerobaculales bacterium]|nr:Arc family DNA-binding protein [Thermoanaerobaculales bacterium]
MAKREAFLMRVDPEVLDAVRRWARDDLRSVNAQVEFILRRALAREGRLSKKGKPPE